MTKRYLDQLFDDIEWEVTNIFNNTNDLVVRRRSRQVLSLCDKGREYMASWQEAFDREWAKATEQGRQEIRDELYRLHNTLSDWPVGPGGQQ